MSQVLRKGAVSSVTREGNETDNDVAERLINDERIKAHGTKTKPTKLPRDYEDFMQWLEAEYYDKYIVLGGVVCRIEEADISELFEGEKTHADRIEYLVKYNDNALSHPDAIKEAVKNCL